MGGSGRIGYAVHARRGFGVAEVDMEFHKEIELLASDAEKWRAAVKAQGLTRVCRTCPFFAVQCADQCKDIIRHIDFWVETFK